MCCKKENVEEKKRSLQKEGARFKVKKYRHHEHHPMNAKLKSHHHTILL
jgi:hypothetical protein